MGTGIKAVDNLIVRYGIQPQPSISDFQRVTILNSQNAYGAGLGLPYCMQQALQRVPATHQLYLHQFYLPYRAQRLASYLVTDEGQLLEQVWYVKDHKYQNAARIIGRRVMSSYLQRANAA